MSIGRRIADHFVAPATGGGSPAEVTPAGPPPVRARAAPLPRAPACIALLAAAQDAPALGAGLALALARRVRAQAALVCLWSPAPPVAGWRAPALPAAGRLASALRLRGHEAHAAGRLVVVRLAAEAEEAAAEAWRACAAVASAGAPTVLVLGAPRAAAFDELLASQDLVVAAVPAGSDPALAQLAVAGLEHGLVLEIPPGRPARSLAGAGLMLPSTRRALAVPVAALPC